MSGFVTKVDFSDNRQIKQYERTETQLSGSTKFGVSFSALTSGPDLDNESASEIINVASSFSGNTGTTNFVFGAPEMDLGLPYISAITNSNSGITQSIGTIYVGINPTVIDGNTVYLSYTGIDYTLTVTQIEETTPGIFTGWCISSSVNYYTASTLDFTGRTIWVDVSGITRTQKLIVTNNPQIGYVLTCSDSEGLATWTPVSGATSGTTFWSAGSGTHGVVLEYSNSDSSGKLSVSEGTGTTASGNYSHSEGGFTIASGLGAHSEGYFSSAIGLVSHAEGIFTSAIGNGSHSEGQYSVANGNQSHTEGEYTTAIGSKGHAEGYKTTAVGTNSHAEGDSTIASGNASHAEGSGTTTIGFFAHSEGKVTTAYGDHTHAEGRSTIASGESSHAEGALTTAIGLRSHAEGENTIASGSRSHAEGYLTKAIGNYSHSEGRETTAIGEDSHAEGLFSTAIGNYSHAGGYRAIASGISSFNHSYDSTSTGTTYGVYGNYSAILGGYNNLIPNGINRSVILGGIGLTATTGDTIFGQNMILFGDLHVCGTTTVFATEVILAEDNNIVLNYGGTHASAIGGGFSIEKGKPDNSDIIVSSTTSGDVSFNTGIIVNGDTGSTQLRLVKDYTPTGSADTAGDVGCFAWDDNYLYIKVSTGWKRTALSGW